MKSHTSVGLTLAQGSMISGSTKQKQNAGSSIIAELYGVHDYMPKLKWVSLFFIEQVKGIPDDDTEITQAIKSIGQVSTVLQDNTSTIQLEKTVGAHKGSKHVMWKSNISILGNKLRKGIYKFCTVLQNRLLLIISASHYKVLYFEFIETPS